MISVAMIAIVVLLLLAFGGPNPAKELKRRLR